MELGMIGLGRMGANMARRLLNAGHRVVVFDPRPEAVQELVVEGAVGADTLGELVTRLSGPRVVWVMVPSGSITDDTVTALADLLSKDDIVIDGGNTYYKDDARRAARLAKQGIQYVDVGTSGGVWGLTEGYSLMIGGDAEVVARLEPIFKALAPAPDQGWGRVGAIGAGHFVKMIHNGIEYGLMQAYAEGFGLLRAKQAYALDVHQIAEIWRVGSVVRSWLLDLTAAALKTDPALSQIEGYVSDSGEGRWTVFEAIDLDVPAPVMTLALQQRLASRQGENYPAKLLAALRSQFGGHAARKVGS